MGKTISERIADFIVQTDPGRLPADVVEFTKLCFLDWLGSAIAGSDKPPTAAMVEVARALGGNPEATLIPGWSPTSAFWAALVNGASSHVVEMDDLHKPSILHPAAPVIPAALALAEREGSGGDELIAAIVVGYEVAIRAGECVGPSHYAFWHSTGTCGTFGAAAAAGRLLGLDRDQLVWALGSAGTQAAGLWEFLVDGAMSKQLHPAKAAADGMLAALLAQRGFTAARRIFEGEKGFCRAMSQAGELGRLTDGLGDGSYRISGTSFKAHAACYHIHSAIDAALKIRAEHGGAPDEIARVGVRLYSAAMDLLEKVDPQNPYAAKFNVPFCVATALLRGAVGLDAFTEERLADAAIRGVMERVELARDPALDEGYPERWPAVVEVETSGGPRHQARVDYPRGDPRNPLTATQVVEKFHDLTRVHLPEVRRRALVDGCLALEKVESMAAFFIEE